MSKVALNWDADGVIDSYTIYRSEQPIDTGNLPSPLAENILQKSFIDESVDVDKEYYYRVASVQSGLVKVSEQIYVQTYSGDKYWNNVVALLHFDDGFKNEKPAKVNKYNATTTSGIFNKSLHIYSRGQDSLCISVEIGHLLTSDFCVEFFYKKLGSLTNSATVVDTRLATGTYNGMLLTFPTVNPNGIALYFGSGGSGWDVSIVPTSFNLDVGDVYHIAATRSGNTFRLFVNGIEIGQQTLGASINIQGGNNIFLGSNVNGTAGVNAVGLFDEFRVTKGVARYTSNFEPPVEPFPSS